MAAAAASKLSARFKAPSEQTQKTWFPTLKRTVWVLSRLDAYVNVRLHPVFCRCLVWGAVMARANRFLGPAGRHLSRFRGRGRHPLSTIARLCVPLDRSSTSQRPHLAHRRRPQIGRLPVHDPALAPPERDGPQCRPRPGRARPGLFELDRGAQFAVAKHVVVVQPAHVGRPRFEGDAELCGDDD